MFKKKVKQVDKTEDLINEIVKLNEKLENLQKVRKMENARDSIMTKHFATQFTNLALKEFEIKDCPFCGKPPHIDTKFKVVNKTAMSPTWGRVQFDNEYETLQTYEFSCINSDCGVKPKTGYHPWLKHTVETWNNRGEGGK